jgi:hypothetical protein
MDLSAIPILDHHCHAVRRPGAPLDGDGLRRSFVETTDAAMAPHVRGSIFYMRALRDLAALLGCAPDEDSLLALRAATPFEAYARRLFEAANFERLLIDTGLQVDDSYDLTGMASLAGRPTAEVLRLETLMERLIATNETLPQVEEALRAELRAAPGRGVVALKSIAAYRGGLHVAPRTADEAAVGMAEAREQARRAGRLRLSERRVLDYLLRAALQEAAAAALPVQFHVAFGDDDADLRTAGPLHLRPLLQDPALRRVPFVLLHCYPYVREAGYLAALYANVFVDVSLTVPLTAHGSAAAFSEALELAPVSKVLFATDAHSIPELFAIGALHGRRALGQALGRLVAEDMLTAGQAEAAAVDILRGNAARLYGIV